MNRRFLFALVSLAAASCAVDDADLRSAAIEQFTIKPAATGSSVFSTTVTIDLKFGYSSTGPATLELQVEGDTVHRSTIDVSSSEKLTAKVEATVPLLREGSNQITGIVRYAGQERTERTTVQFAWETPKISVMWDAPVYTPRVSLTAAGHVTVTAASAYAIDEVSYALDDGPFIAAAPVMGMPGKYDLLLTNPDLGKRTVGIRVVTSHDRRRQTTTVFDTALRINPIFDCNTPASSMLPNTDLIQNVNTESRVMLGYFGDPRLHSTSFVLTARNNNFNGQQQVVSVVGRITEPSFTAHNVEYNVSPFRICDNGCNQDYALEAFVDGTSLCRNATFGKVYRY